MHCNVKVLDWNLKPKWCNFDMRGSRGWPNQPGPPFWKVPKKKKRERERIRKEKKEKRKKEKNRKERKKRKRKEKKQPGRWDDPQNKPGRIKSQYRLYVYGYSVPGGHSHERANLNLAPFTLLQVRTTKNLDGQPEIVAWLSMGQPFIFP